MSAGLLRPGDSVRCPENGQLFECVKLLRECRCGEVWFAVRASPAGEVVLKVIDKETLSMLRSDDEEHGRVSFESPEREFRTLAFLNYHSHPNVIQARGPCFEVDNRLVCVMEFMPGGDMLDLVARHRKFDETTARHFFQQIVRGVRYMHDLRVAHLDLSLENVVLSRDYRVAKLIDFGLALPVSRDASGKEHISGRGSRGKLFYVAPEVFTEQAFVATVADVWSLGIMLFMMLTGSPPLVEGPCDKDPRFPFIRDRKLEVILDAWKARESVSDMVLDLLKGMLTVDPATRLSLSQVEDHVWMNPTGTRASVVDGRRAIRRDTSAGAGGGVGAGGAHSTGDHSAGTIGSMDTIATATIVAPASSSGLPGGSADSLLAMGLGFSAEGSADTVASAAAAAAAAAVMSVGGSDDMLAALAGLALPEDVDMEA